MISRVLCSMATKVFQYANSQILGKLSIIVDVSCDASNPHNPLPFITYNTTFSSPTKRVVDGSDASPPVDVCSIDHLPSLVPRSSSSEYSEGFHRHLLGFGQSSVWQRALDIFNEKTAQLQK